MSNSKERLPLESDTAAASAAAANATTATPTGTPANNPPADIESQGSDVFPRATMVNPTPLGISAFAVSTFVLGFYQGQFGGITIPNVFVPVAFFYGGIASFLAGQFEFYIGNTFGAVVLNAFGGFWFSLACIYIPSFNVLAGYAADLQQGYYAVAIYLTSWLIFVSIVLFALVSTRKWSLVIMFAAIWLNFLLSIIAFYKDPLTHHNVLKAAGSFSIIAAIFGLVNTIEEIITHENSLFTLPAGTL